MNESSCIVIPAAGPSTRLGQPKQLVEFDGISMIRRTVEFALDASPNVFVVVGCEDAAVRREIEDAPVIVVDNPDWEKGMGSSISIGVRAALDRMHDLDCVLIHLCDMPSIDGAHLKKLIERRYLTKAEVVFTEYTDTEGVPAAFGPRLIEELLFLDGDTGARQLIDRCDVSLKKSVRFDGNYVDIDLPEDLGLCN